MMTSMRPRLRRAILSLATLVSLVGATATRGLCFMDRTETGGAHACCQQGLRSAPPGCCMSGASETAPGRLSERASGLESPAVPAAIVVVTAPELHRLAERVGAMAPHDHSPPPVLVLRV